MSENDAAALAAMNAALQTEITALKDGFNALRSQVLLQQASTQAAFAPHSQLNKTPPFVQFMFELCKQQYCALMGALDVLEGLKGLHSDISSAMEKLSEMRRSLEVLKASFDAAAKCSQHHFDVIEAVFNGMRSHIVQPSEDVLSGKTRLFDLPNKVFTTACSEVEKRRNSSPLTSKGNDGNDGGARNVGPKGGKSHGGNHAAFSHPYNRGGGYGNHGQQWGPPPQPRGMGRGGGRGAGF